LNYIDAAVTAGIVGGLGGLAVNAAICKRRFPTDNIRRVQKVAYRKCLRNPFTKKSKKVDEPKQCSSLREKIKTYIGFSGKCAFKFKGKPEMIKKCNSDMRHVKASLVAKKKSLGCL